MNRPRQGGPPQHIGRHYEPPDSAIAAHPLDMKIESGLAEPNRDTARNRDLARQNGWTDEEYERWVENGETP